MIIDSHVHIGKKDECENIIKNSKFKDIYRLYSCINPDTIDNTKKFLKDVDKYFAIPLFFCETDIEEANKLLLDMIKNDKKAIPILLLPKNNNNTINLLKYNILKEHFSLHNPNDISDRIESYKYLNDVNGFLLLHTLSSETLRHVKYLRNNFPNMRIIVAHLGRNAKCDYEYTKNIIDTFSEDDKIYTDISTIDNPDLIKYAVKKYGSNRVLYGSDFPFEKSPNITEMEYMISLEKACLTTKEKQDLLYNSANNILKLSKIK